MLLLQNNVMLAVENSTMLTYYAYHIEVIMLIMLFAYSEQLPWCVCFTMLGMCATLACLYYSAYNHAKCLKAKC